MSGPGAGGLALPAIDKLWNIFWEQMLWRAFPIQSDHQHGPLPRIARHHRRHLLWPDRDCAPQPWAAPKVLQPRLLQDDKAAEMVGKGTAHLVHGEAARQGLCHVPLGQVRINLSGGDDILFMAAIQEPSLWSKIVLCHPTRICRCRWRLNIIYELWGPCFIWTLSSEFRRSFRLTAIVSITCATPKIEIQKDIQTTSEQPRISKLLKF